MLPYYYIIYILRLLDNTRSCLIIIMKELEELLLSAPPLSACPASRASPHRAPAPPVRVAARGRRRKAPSHRPRAASPQSLHPWLTIGLEHAKNMLKRAKNMLKAGRRSTSGPILHLFSHTLLPSAPLPADKRLRSALRHHFSPHAMCQRSSSLPRNSLRS